MDYHELYKSHVLTLLNLEITIHMKLLYCVNALATNLKLKTLFLENKIEFEENFIKKMKL